MLRKYASFISRYTEHPLLVSLFVAALTFAVGAVLIAQLVGSTLGSVAGAHLMAYAILSAAMGAVGYVLLVLIKIGRKIRHSISDIQY